MERAQRKQRVTLEQILPKDSPKDGIDLIKQLLVFNPEKRPSAESCLSHPYVARFNTKKEPLDLGYQVIPPIDDDIQLSVDEYRSKLYRMIREKKAARDLERERRYAEEQAKKALKKARIFELFQIKSAKRSFATIFFCLRTESLLNFK